jgi:hypothetical protein
MNQMKQARNVSCKIIIFDHKKYDELTSTGRTSFFHFDIDFCFDFLLYRRGKKCGYN